MEKCVHPAGKEWNVETFVQAVPYFTVVHPAFQIWTPAAPQEFNETLDVYVRLAEIYFTRTGVISPRYVPMCGEGDLALIYHCFCASQARSIPQEGIYTKKESDCIHFIGYDPQYFCGESKEIRDMAMPLPNQDMSFHLGHRITANPMLMNLSPMRRYANFDTVVEIDVRAYRTKFNKWGECIWLAGQGGISSRLDCPPDCFTRMYNFRTGNEIFRSDAMKKIGIKEYINTFEPSIPRYNVHVEARALVTTNDWADSTELPEIVPEIGSVI